MNCFQKIHALVCKDIKEENEPKDTALLIRVLSIIDIFFLSVNAICDFVLFGAKIGISTLVGMALMAVVLLLSYAVKMRYLIYIYYIALSINVAFLVVMFGLSFMFQSQFYIIFLLFFYRAVGSKAERVISVIVSALLLMSLIFYSRGHASIIDVDLSNAHVSTFFCAVYIISKSVAIAYFFRAKFSASEEKILKYSQKLELLATTDPLTKLQNRRGMVNHISRCTEDMGKTGMIFTVAIGDIDFFKSINDTYGHDGGDYILETLASMMSKFFEGKGMVARWGGEEFLFCLENMNGDIAFEEINRLRHVIEKYDFNFDGKPIKVTMTFGVEEYDSSLSSDAVIAKADEKLYMGKQQGRNRVIY